MIVLRNILTTNVVIQFEPKKNINKILKKQPNTIWCYSKHVRLQGIERFTTKRYAPIRTFMLLLENQIDLIVRKRSNCWAVLHDINLS